MLQKVSIKVFQFFSHLEAKHYLEFSVWGIKIKRKIVIAPTIPFDSARNRNANLSEQQKKKLTGNQTGISAMIRRTAKWGASASHHHMGAQLRRSPHLKTPRYIMTQYGAEGFKEGALIIQREAVASSRRRRSMLKVPVRTGSADWKNYFPVFPVRIFHWKNQLSERLQQASCPIGTPLLPPPETSRGT